MPIDIVEAPELAAVASVHRPDVTDLEFEASMTELCELAKTLGYEVVRRSSRGTCEIWRSVAGPAYEPTT